MVKIDEPALALNDSRVGGHIRMSRNLRVRPDDSRDNILGAIAAVASGTPGGRLQSLVLNSHGAPGYLVMGEGFWRPHTSLFERLAGRVNNIWITACSISSTEQWKPGDRLAAGMGKGEVGNGFEFCQQLATRANCNVIASDNDQDVPQHHRIPPGFIDAWEGTVRCFRPNGVFAWIRYYDLHNSE